MLSSDTAALISVVTVVYNGAHEIARTIASVLQQDCPSVEYVVIDGNSTDGTQDIVRGYGDAIARFVSEPDRGVYDGMNKGAAVARGEFILFMNCGDVFASPQALSQLLAAATPGQEQALFGSWLRQEGPGVARLCAPVLERGLFNHQSVAYSRSVHAWHGPYAVVKGLTTADYLFFATLMRTRRIPCTTVDTTVALIDVNGISAGLQTFAQKQAIDYLCGNTSRLKMAFYVVAHPPYHHIKKFLKRWAKS